MSISTVKIPTNDLKDPLAEAFKTDEAFQTILKNGIFDDYFNTFLSLPIFAKRLMYRKDNGIFEIEPPISRTSHHLLHDKVLSWTRTNRAPLFLKTPICNEYRLCQTLSQLPVRINDGNYTPKELASFQRNYFRKVIDMQRMKRHFYGSIGMNLIMFWLDAERYYHQVPANCHRFVLKEITSKYLIKGAPYELNEKLRQNINAYFQNMYIEIHSTKEYRNLLLPVQKLVLRSLEEYWIPKYMQHRLRRRFAVTGRWGALITSKVKNFTGGDLVNPPDLVDKIIDLKKKGLADTHKSEICDDANQTDQKVEEDETKKSSSSEESEDTAEKSDEIIMWQNTRKRTELEKMVEGLELNYNKPSKPEKKEKKPKKKSPKSSLKATVHQSPKKASGRHESKYAQKMRVGIRGSSAEEGRATRTEIKVTADSSDEDTDEVTKFQLPPLEKHFAHDRRKPVQKTTFYEALHMEQAAYEADNEDNNANLADIIYNNEDIQPTTVDRPVEDLRLPIITTVKNTSESFTVPLTRVNYSKTRVRSPFTKTFLQTNTLAIIPTKERYFRVLTAALTTDPMAGYPLLEHFKKNGDSVAEVSLKFWNAANQILTDSRFNEPITRMKQFKVLVTLYLGDSVGSEMYLNADLKRELSDLLLRDLGITKLMEACDIVAEKLSPAWEDFLRRDEETFLRNATKAKRISQTGDYQHHNILLDIEDNEYDGTFGPDPFNIDDFLHEKIRERKFHSKRTWRALQLAISIYTPGSKVLPDADEKNKWSTDDEKDQNTEDHSGSLTSRQLNIINRKAQRINQEKLESLFNNSEFTNLGLVHDYTGTITAFNNGNNYYNRTMMEHAMIEAGNKNNTAYDVNNPNNTTENINEDIIRQYQAKPQRPRDLNAILTDPRQLDMFKTFLVNQQYETPLLFWVAVESMRTSVNHRIKQGRGHGIIKRYFGPSTDYGKHLNINEEIIQDILDNAEKVPISLLLTAQSFVVKKLEKTWFPKYVRTFKDDEGGVMGITHIPIYGYSSTRSVKDKSRGLWKMFTRNVISFRRGIMSRKSLKMFRNFLKLQHQLTVAQYQAGNPEAERNTYQLAPRIIVNNKLVFTEKLVADLSFWSEVEKYKDFADAVVMCAKLGNYTKDDELIVVKKAWTILDCFIDSQVSPRLQINIPIEMAENIVSLVQSDTVERGLFHEAALTIFSTLIHFWKKFCLYRFLPKEPTPEKWTALKKDRSAQIAIKQKAILANQVKKVSLPADEDNSKLMFSIQLGLRLALRQGKKKKIVDLHADGRITSHEAVITSSLNEIDEMPRYFS